MRSWPWALDRTDRFNSRLGEMIAKAFVRTAVAFFERRPQAVEVPAFRRRLSGRPCAQPHRCRARSLMERRDDAHGWSYSWS